jgi:O-antigen/teichoic acid export membrane protein
MRAMSRRVLEWFKDRAVRKVVRYGIPAAVGKLGMSVAGLITMALLARHLGPAPFGVIAIIRTVVTMVDQYANCNTWQAIVKFGTEAVARNQPRDVERIIKLSVWIDLITGLIAALIVAGLALLLPAAFDWTTREAVLCAIYGVTLATRVSGSSDGIFRICDAYRAQAVSSSIAAAIITVTVAVAIAFDASLEGCVYALIIGEVLGNIVVTLSSFRVARDGGFGNWPRVSLAGVRTAFPGLARFLFATNAQLTVKTTSAELDMVMVGGLLGNIASGLYRIVKQLGTIPGRIFMPFEQVVFTELARAAAMHDYAGFNRLLRRFTALVAIGSFAVWLVAAIAATPIVKLVAGPAFIAAADPFRWYLLAMVLVIANAPLLRGFVALGRPGLLFWFELVMVAVLGIGLVLGAWLAGLVGITIAVALHRALKLATSMLLIEAIVRQSRHEHASHEVGAEDVDRPEAILG